MASYSDEFVGSWANETDDNRNNSAMDGTNSVNCEMIDSRSTYSHNGSSSPLKAESRSRDPMDSRDLRHRLRSNRGESENDDHEHSHRKDYRFESDYKSPTKSPSLPRSHRRSNDNQSSRPNYRRDKDGLSPLRSPLNPDQRSSRVNSSSRRRSINDSSKGRKENYTPKTTSPSKRNKYSDSKTNARPTLDMNVEQQRFRRRLDLPSDKVSDSKVGGYLDPKIDEDRITLERREKAIAYGKSTESYKLYIKTLPKNERGENRIRHPRTPIKELRYSRRNWDAQIKAWKKYVHNWAAINFPNLPLASKRTSASESASESSSQDKKELEGEEENDSIDLNDEDEDESFLEGFELDYALEDDTGESESLSMS